MTYQSHRLLNAALGSKYKMFSIFKTIWASPASLIGILFALLSIPTGLACRNGVLEIACQGLLFHLFRLGVPCVCFGHVVVGLNKESLEVWREHERVHVCQYERWGLLMLPAYVMSSFWVYIQGGHPYYDNWFEKAAYKVGP